MRGFTTELVVTVTLVCACCPQRALAAQSDITFYRVPLMCPAAQGLGCGTRAKPILLDLQRRATVNEAWLSQTGEILAIVWKHHTTAAERRSAITAVTEAHHMSMDELKGTSRDDTLKGFRSGIGWHKGADVDRLSAEEARVIAERLLERASAKTPTVNGKLNVVTPVLTEAIRRQLVETCASPADCREALLTAVRPHLNESEIAALGQALDLGFTPVTGER